MELQYQFPLFDKLLIGCLSPFLEENHADVDYKLRIEEQILNLEKDEGCYALRFIKTTHPKQLYYSRLLLSETIAYCNDLRCGLMAEEDANIRAYYREIILDRHLTTCLKRLGELINTKKLNYALLLHPKDNVQLDDICNCYCLHLLKACVAKAYAELQEILSDTVSVPFNEKTLYSTYLHELAPVSTFLRKLNTDPHYSKPATKPTENSAEKQFEKQNAPATVVMDKDEVSVFLVKDAAKLLKVSDKTIVRRIQAKEIKAVKDKGRWLIDKAALMAQIRQ